MDTVFAFQFTALFVQEKFLLIKKEEENKEIRKPNVIFSATSHTVRKH